MAPFEPAAAPTTRLYDPTSAWNGWVSVDDQPVEIYRVEHKDRKSTCYIEARDGKEFVVNFGPRLAGGTDLAVYAVIDGSRVEGLSLTRARGTLPHKFIGARISSTTIRPFQFAHIALTDDADEACQTESVVKNLGTIQLEVYRTRILGKVPNHEQYDSFEQPVVDEKSKKATMSHSTAYGAAKTSVSSGQADSVDWIDRLGSPFWTLEFKYRSRALLELEDIVKPVVEPSPPPANARATSASTSASGSGSPVVRDKMRKATAISISDSDGDDDLRAKVARLEAEVGQLRGGGGAGGVKREKEDVKPEVEGERIGKTSEDEKGRTVIDLLDEDDD
ncbi:hypothetical protein JCM3775_005939 [Rhodotorula graminis]|uniref:DUF7918 domain-containing protein n=1 Tax=Rhodotorula graminis (strain WP1) TaxID=578459 RepID=A0A194SFI5_RHOGW|nr:uncharacterized protein RHOBADRAFT_50822 [Rhodotorula graminis WP1]KPV78346.1 hypothetical protein RHOBADRAFT_50822 [Rhodotorula graminis WP1]